MTYFRLVNPSSYTLRVDNKLYTFSGLDPVAVSIPAHIERLKAKADMVEECDAKGRPIWAPEKSGGAITSNKLSYTKLPKKDAKDNIAGGPKAVPEPAPVVEEPQETLPTKKRGRKKKAKA